MRYYICLVVLLGLFSSCSEDESRSEVFFQEDGEAVSELKDKEIDFADFYYKFSATIESQNYQIFNGFIHPNLGCYIIESPGAMPVFTNVYDVGEFVSKSGGQWFFDLPFTQIDHVVSFESLPKVICEAQAYDKKGCFAGLSEEFKSSEIWNYAGLSSEENAEVISLVNSLSISVVNTYNYTFHFSKIESKWYLSFIDLRMPCSA